ncbi:hypothetical protein [Anditalea andensis]|uniref:Outer membrane protein beta-barrel domain-containing protein n=1 Tax=Anditalea andensis TaxID=1048983 RepID=A0A074KVY9_9BACT|nr:hypothetical protein [Anditalea andensis]KEO74116.1 hypothetical protein EL17_08205 [Anditalea andensis]
MIKRLLISFIGFVLFPVFTATAQEKIPTQSVYVELGGAGLPFSFNYDFRFDKEKVDSWGMRVGAGGYALSGGDSFFSLPIMANKLIGKAPHYFEIGAGATLIAFKTASYSYCSDGYYDQNGNFICNNYIISPNDETSFILDINGSPSLMGTFNIGYRKIPIDGGFTWRINISPIFNDNGFWPLWLGVSFGYAF